MGSFENMIYDNYTFLDIKKEHPVSMNKLYCRSIPTQSHSLTNYLMLYMGIYVSCHTKPLPSL